MLTLFALLHDPAGAVSKETLIRDLKERFAWAGEYTISTQTLTFPRVTRVVLEKSGWRVTFNIRDKAGMTLSLPELQQMLGKKGALPPDFLAYDKEIAISFGDDPDKRFTNELIHIGEFVRENYPGVVLFDQYKQDFW